MKWGGRVMGERRTGKESQMPCYKFGLHNEDLSANGIHEKRKFCEI